LGEAGEGLEGDFKNKERRAKRDGLARAFFDFASDELKWPEL